MLDISLWSCLQWMRVIVKSCRIFCLCFIDDHSFTSQQALFQIPAWTCTTKRVYLESVYLYSFLPFPRISTWVRAVNPDFWAEVPGESCCQWPVTKWHLHNLLFDALFGQSYFHQWATPIKGFGGACHWCTACFHRSRRKSLFHKSV